MTEKKPIKTTIPEHEVMKPGHLACQGCGASLAMRYATKAIEGEAMFTLPACCWSVIDGPFPYSSLGLPLLHMAFEAAGATASGIRAALNMLGQKKVKVIAWGGDGGTFDIGFQAISGAAERDEDILYICYDNEAYMNTGIQRSSATPYGAWTTTTPVKHFEKRPKKDMVEIMAAHKIPYVANVSVAYPEDFVKKVQKARSMEGFKFIHAFAPCPSGWKIKPEDTIKIAKLAVQSKIFPLYEVEYGVKYNLTVKVPNPVPVLDYLKLQGRFRHLTEEEINIIQKGTDENWDLLMKKLENK